VKPSEAAYPERMFNGLSDYVTMPADYGVVFAPGDRLDLYVDGQKRVHTSAASVPKINVSSTDNAYSIGAKYAADTSTLSRTLEASLANMRMFDRALPAAAIAAAFEYGL
jgi:hypothetical protein